MVSFLALYGGMSGGITIHEAAATSLFTFLFTGILGSWLYHRRKSIAWPITAPVCAGAVVFGYAGAAVAATLDPQPLAMLIALLIVAVGIYVFLPVRPRTRPRAGRGWRGQVELAAVGAASGFGSGFSGAGGPLFSVPIMVILGYMPLTAVATSQVLQIIAALSGSIGNMRHGFIHWEIAIVITVFELAGVIVGVKLAHVSSPDALRRLAGTLCVLSGGLLLIRSL